MADLKSRLVAALEENLATEKRPRLPEGGRMLWDWFIDLHGGRTYHMAGPNPISYADMLAYCVLKRIPLPMPPHHLEIILAMDRAFLAFAVRKNQKPPDGVKAAPPVSKQKLSSKLFDAMFR